MKENSKATATDTASITTSVSHSFPPFPFEDGAVDIEHKPETGDLSLFYTMLAVWVRENYITRDGYGQLIEVFQLVASLDELRNTPTYKDTLMTKLIKSFPLRKLKKISVDLDPLCLLSRLTLKEDMFAFDFPDTVATMLSSPSIAKDIYKGMAKYIDGPIRNPWEARWWGESFRTSSGEYYHYLQIAGGGPIFPSDFVQYLCRDKDCRLDGHRCEGIYLGRIVYYGKDYTSAAKEKNTTGSPIFLIQCVYKRVTLPLTMKEIEYTMAYFQST
ncbi:hypothetical protein F5Y18DRAFT_288731 [Xylariaceae sp. FL1019]|nr:hypothetical protein F5Y18DRAFT_288731 [Xylariaceae sp. FL1019]